MLLRTRVWCRSEIRINTKVQIYQAMVKTTLVYGSETWPVNWGPSQTPDVGSVLLAPNFHVPWNHFIQNTAVLPRRKIGSLQKALLKRRLWFVSPCSSLITGWIYPWEDCPAPQCNRMLAELEWLRMVKEDVEPFLDPRVSNTLHWNRDWLTLIDSITSDHRVWLAFVREIRSTESA